MCVASARCVVGWRSSRQPAAGMTTTTQRAPRHDDRSERHHGRQRDDGRGRPRPLRATRPPTTTGDDDRDGRLPRAAPRRAGGRQRGARGPEGHDAARRAVAGLQGPAARRQPEADTTTTTRRRRTTRSRSSPSRSSRPRTTASPTPARSTASRGRHQVHRLQELQGDHRRRRRPRLRRQSRVRSSSPATASRCRPATACSRWVPTTASTTPRPSTCRRRRRPRPTCRRSRSSGTRAGDGVLTIGSILPQTGSLAFLGPPEFAGVRPGHQGHQRQRWRPRQAGRRASPVTPATRRPTPPTRRSTVCCRRTWTPSSAPPRRVCRSR